MARGGMAKAYLACGAAYAAAMCAGVLSLRLLGGLHPVAAAGFADLCATAVVFLSSVLANNSSMYDPYWSVAPLPIAAFFLARAGSLGPFRAASAGAVSTADASYGGMAAGTVAVSAAALVLLAAWSVRLTSNWLKGWRGLGHEDWRYRGYRSRGVLRYWAVSFAGFHLFPTAVVFVGLAPLYFVFRADGRLIPAAVAAGLATVLAGIALETAADSQLRRFRLANPGGSALAARGLWRHARHPNYLGEILVWAGISVTGFGAAGRWHLLLCFLPILLMFVGISVPMMDAHLRESRPGFAGYAASRRALLPLPRVGRRA